MASSEGSGRRRSQRDKERAAQLKRHGVERTTGRCAVCYAIVSTQGPKSRYTHVCPGGRLR
jgi:hypothetical protein